MQGGHKKSTDRNLIRNPSLASSFLHAAPGTLLFKGQFFNISTKLVS